MSVSLRKPRKRGPKRKQGTDVEYEFPTINGMSVEQIIGNIQTSAATLFNHSNSVVKLWKDQHSNGIL
jgi:hypothetical protein